MGLQRPEILELPPALWKPAPFECPTDPRLQRQLNRVPGKIERSIEALGPQEHLSVSKTCPGDCSQVFRKDRTLHRSAWPSRAPERLEDVPGRLLAGLSLKSLALGTHSLTGQPLRVTLKFPYE